MIYLGSSTYLTKATTSEGEIQITTNKATQRYPAIYENIIVWEDDRNGISNKDIFLFNLATKQEKQITTNESRQLDPDVYGNYVVWEDNRNGNRNWDIYGYNLKTDKEFVICTNISNQFSPSIYENFVVWIDKRANRSNIYLYDLAQEKEFLITSNETKKYNLGSNSDKVVYIDEPTIYSDRIVYIKMMEKNNSLERYSDIFLFNITTDKEIAITNDPYKQSNPTIYGDRIVWTDMRNGAADVYMFELTNNKETRITYNDDAQADPVIYGDLIVWWDLRNSYVDPKGFLWGDADVYMYDLSKKKEYPISTAGGHQWHLDIHGNRIVWDDERASCWNPDESFNDDIYMFEYCRENSNGKKISSWFYLFIPILIVFSIATMVFVITQQKRKKIKFAHSKYLIQHGYKLLRQKHEKTTNIQNIENILKKAEYFLGKDNDVAKRYAEEAINSMENIGSNEKNG